MKLTPVAFDSKLPAYQKQAEELWAPLGWAEHGGRTEIADYLRTQLERPL